MVEVKLKLNVSKVLSLRDSDIISDKDAEDLLKQFSKEDLIKHLLSDEDEDQDDLEEQDIKEESKQEDDTDVEDDVEDDLEDLDL